MFHLRSTTSFFRSLAVPTLAVPLAVLGLTFALACNSTPEAPAEGSSGWASVHGRPGARPGSHDDWCGEHQVPESLCTRCNPTLIPAFKASGDWCEEHGLPESQCLICNPELRIERPPPEGSP
ncbi:MAG: hypothetical protein H6721_10375 [Sandaracinus sp.]|nr:hypothetical protein [Myxococcales bacterium]MCB9632523.1 hypothetical protein [Sandaracinus sp.]